MTTPGDEPMPLPIVQAETDEVMAVHFGGGDPTPESGLGCAFLWWLALQDFEQNQNALAYLSDAPAAWGDYSQAAEHIADLSITTEPIVIQGGPDAILGIKFIDFDGEDAGRVFGAAPLTDVWIVTVIRDTVANEFRVWGLSHNHVPTVNEIFNG